MCRFVSMAKSHLGASVGKVRGGIRPRYLEGTHCEEQLIHETDDSVLQSIARTEANRRSGQENSSSEGRGWRRVLNKVSYLYELSSPLPLQTSASERADNPIVRVRSKSEEVPNRIAASVPTALIAAMAQEVFTPDEATFAIHQPTDRLELNAFPRPST